MPIVNREAVLHQTTMCSRNSELMFAVTGIKEKKTWQSNQCWSVGFMAQFSSYVILHSLLVLNEEYSYIL